MFFDQFPYVAVATLTGHLEADVQNLLEANARPKTFAHVKAVSEVCAQIAVQYGLTGVSVAVGLPLAGHNGLDLPFSGVFGVEFFAKKWWRRLTFLW